MKDLIRIDINADVGEGIGNEAELMPYLSSCSIACGGHAGNLESMTKVVKLAKKHDLKIGAHPSFPDKPNFGRAEMNISTSDLFNSLKQQIKTLQNVVHAENIQLQHIKPHGALYNHAAKDEKTAQVIIAVMKSMIKPVKLYAPFNSVIANLARQENIEVVYEAFADRNYNDDLSLVSRENKDAILHEKTAVLDHVLNMIKNQKVKTISGVEAVIETATLCVHGDTKNALEILNYLSQELPKNEIKIQ